MTNQPFSCKISPLEWPDAVLANGVKLYGYGIITTSYKFSVVATVTTAGGSNIGTLSLSPHTGFASGYLGKLTVPAPSQKDAVFPLSIQGTITCDTTFSWASSAQTALGQKPNPSSSPPYIPIAYMASVFCNDAGSDNDWNDLCLNFQLFSQSTD